MSGRSNRFALLLAVALVSSACTGGAPRAPAPSPSSVPSTSPSTSPTPFATPEWFKDGVLYEIFVRSFADSNGDGIGDLRGIENKLDYLKGLGVTAVWLTPIFASPSYHGYDTTDYYTINPDFGTKDDLVSLVGSAHAKGIRVILDFVASHTSNLFPYFKDAYGNPGSQYSDWYVWKDAAHRVYQSFANVPTLPSLNHANPVVNQYYIDVAKYWMDLDGDGDYTDGIDGFRCDYALGSPHAFWRQLRAALKPLNPDVLLLGEVWVDSPSAQTPYFQDQFDALFDFPLYIQLQANPQISGDGVLNGSAFLSSLNNIVKSEAGQFPADAIRVRFAGNHDTNRIASEEEGNAARERLAALLVASLDGTPMIYYGDELGMSGEKGSGPIYDEYTREPMEWYGSDAGPDQPAWFKESRFDQPNDGVSVQEEESDQRSLLNYYRQIYAMRAANPALATGGFELLPTDVDGVWAFWRFTRDDVVSAIFNFNPSKVTVRPDLSTAPNSIGTTAVDLLTGTTLKPINEAFTLGPAQALLLDWTIGSS
jgi:alpha-amylase